MMLLLMQDVVACWGHVLQAAMSLTKSYLTNDALILTIIAAACEINFFVKFVVPISQLSFQVFFKANFSMQEYDKYLMAQYQTSCFSVEKCLSRNIFYRRPFLNKTFVIELSQNVFI